jgi:hypothetical protein
VSEFPAPESVALVGFTASTREDCRAGFAPLREAMWHPNTGLREVVDSFGCQSFRSVSIHDHTN